MALTFGRCHATKRLTRYAGSSSVSQNGMLSGPGGNVSRPMRDIPGPTGLPTFGSWFRYKLGTLSTYDYHKNMQSLRERHGPIFKDTIAGTTIVHLFDPDDIKHVYQSSRRAPHTKPMMQPSKYYRIKRNLGLGLNNVNGDDWQKMRSAVQSVLMRPRSARLFIPLSACVTQDFLTRITRLRGTDGHVSDFGNELRRWNMESGFHKFLETRLGCLEDDMDPIYQAMIDTNAEVLRDTSKLNYSLGLYHFIPTRVWWRYVRAEDVYYREGQKIFEKALCNMEHLSSRGELEGRYIFLSDLMRRDGLSKEDVQTLSISATFDGLNTIVPSMVGQLFLLASNQHAQKKLYEEICQVCPEQEAAISADQLEQMSYLKACFKEGFRFFPISAKITRVPTEDVVIQDYLIPAGTTVNIHPGLILRDDRYLSNPEIYSPDRWLRDAGTHTVDLRSNPFLAVPFGFGPRTCVAKRVAEQEMYLLTIRLLQNYRLEWPHSRTMQQKHDVLLYPDMEPDFRFIPR